MYYIGVKLVQADAMNLGDYNKLKGWTIPEDEDPLKEGYVVTYPDGYVSWCPKKQFEDANLPMELCGKSITTITPEVVKQFIVEMSTFKVGRKTTVVHALLRNGFELVESSSCVDLENYDEELGEQLCMTALTKRVWHLLGFLLQTAKNGFKQEG